MTQGVAAIITNWANMRGSDFGWKGNRSVIMQVNPDKFDDVFF
jgi:hypothetical protein